MAARAKAILDFWFGEDFAAQPPAQVAQRQSKLWWSKNPLTDAEVKTRFEPLLHSAATNRMADWSDTPEALLALVVLFDQLPRNMYRHTPQAFEYDGLARQCCQLMLAMGYDQQLPAIGRVFAYLPLEHAEDIDDQDYAVQLMSALAKSQQDQGDDARQAFDGYADYARRHREVIQRFGRFPHRNQILGRTSSAEEIAFLKQPGSSF